jgi:hypothetical protein
MLRCRGFRRDAFLDDHTGSVLSPSNIVPTTAGPRLHGREFGDIHAAITKGTPIPPESRSCASPVLLLAEERVAGYRRS